MSSVLSNSNRANPYLSEITDQFSAFQESCRCLVISHNEPQLVNRLSQAIDEHSAMLQLPHAEWDFENAWLADVIRWAIRRVGVQQIALVGHSTMGNTQPISLNAQAGMTESPADKKASIYDRLIDGVTRRQQQIQQAKELFAQQYHKFLKIPDVSARSEQNYLEVHGLFYLAESGLFLAYDPQSNTFHPLVQSTISC